MATGIDRMYPNAHRGLREKLEVEGCSMTEFPSGTPPLQFHFPRRNRLIAGLARRVIVVEAPRKSGAILTAMLALDYNREVFAAPGRTTDSQSQGCNNLIKTQQASRLLTACTRTKPVHLKRARLI